MIKFVSDLRQVGGFLCTPVSSENKTDRHDIAEILLKVPLSTIILTLYQMTSVFAIKREKNMSPQRNFRPLPSHMQDLENRLIGVVYC